MHLVWICLMFNRCGMFVAGGAYVSIRYCASIRTYIQWNLSWETTAMRDCLSWMTTSFWQKVLHSSVYEPVTKDHLSWDHIFMANSVVFQDRFYCIIIWYKMRICHSKTDLIQCPGHSGEDWRQRSLWPENASDPATLPPGKISCFLYWYSLLEPKQNYCTTA